MIVAVALAGGLGALCRFQVDTRLRMLRPELWPWPTVLVNVTASLLLGLIVGLGDDGILDTSTVTVLGAGFCGGYSTFSTAALDLVQLLRTRRGTAAAVYGSVGTVAPVIAAAAGVALAGRWR